MANYQKLAAMFFGGIGALELIYLGHIEVGAALLGTILGFAVGEANGKRIALKE